MTDHPRRPAPAPGPCSPPCWPSSRSSRWSSRSPVSSARRRPRPPPTSRRLTSSDSLPAPSTASESAAPSSGAPPERVAEPVSLAIPAIDVRTDLMSLGLNGDGTVEVPPLEEDDRAGGTSPAPSPAPRTRGDPGPRGLRAVGARRLSTSAPWSRGRGSVPAPTGRWPSSPSTASSGIPRTTSRPSRSTAHRRPELRLITCGGAFDSGARSYEDNVIVFATLVDTRGA